MKKKLVSLLVIAVMVVGVCCPVSAATPPPTEREETQAVQIAESLSHSIAPYWISTSYVSHGISIDKSGKSLSSVSFNLYDRSYKVYLTVTLQKQDGARFNDHASPWSASGTGNVFFSKSYYVTKGSYRIKTVGKVYDANGKFVETVTLYSKIATY